MESIKVNENISFFIKFLNCSWKSVKEFYSDENNRSEKYDWMQANWEQLVECSISKKINKEIRLEVYGEGADANGESSKILFPNDLPTHVVKFKLKGKSKDILNSRDLESDEYFEIEEFVAEKDGWYSTEDPFDYILFDCDGQQSLISVNEVDFYLRET